MATYLELSSLLSSRFPFMPATILATQWSTRPPLTPYQRLAQAVLAEALDCVGHIPTLNVYRQRRSRAWHRAQLHAEALAWITNREETDAYLCFPTLCHWLGIDSDWLREVILANLQLNPPAGSRRSPWVNCADMPLIPDPARAEGSRETRP
jgi:hypothetical protein